MEKKNIKYLIICFLALIGAAIIPFQSNILITFGIFSLSLVAGVISIILKGEKLKNISEKVSSSSDSSFSALPGSLEEGFINCPGCKKEIKEGSSFCPECGYHIPLFLRTRS